MDNLGRLYVLAKGHLHAAQTRETTGDNMATDLVSMECAMWEALISHLRKFIKPLTEYVPEKAHVAMTLLWDHRYRQGEMFFLDERSPVGGTRAPC